MTYSLVEQSWIPVLEGSKRREVGLREALLRAHEIDGLSTESPMEMIATFRQVILPLYLDAVFVEPGCRPPQTAKEWAELWEARVLDRWPSWAPAGVAGSTGPITRYLERYADRFDVFGDRPFAQVANLQPCSGGPKPISVLIASAASGNNVPLFSNRTEADPPELDVPAAIRSVLVTHCWDTAAIKSGAAGDPAVKGGKTTGNPTGPLGGIGVVLPIGRTLAETLLLHVTCELPIEDGDRPQWRADPGDADSPARPGWCSRPSRGLLDFLTWQSRRIRLIPEAGPGGSTIIRQVVLAAGDRLEGPIPQWDPHTAWRMSRERGVQVPVRHAPGRAAWRGMQPLLSTTPGAEGTSTPILRHIDNMTDQGHLPVDYPLQAKTLGVQYGNQYAVIEDVFGDDIPLPIAALHPESPAHELICAMVRQAEELRTAANNLDDQLRQAAGGSPPERGKGERLGDRMVHDLTKPAMQALKLLQWRPDRIDDANERWRAGARSVSLAAADQALADTAPSAFLGRVSGGKVSRSSVAQAIYRHQIRRILGSQDS